MRCFATGLRSLDQQTLRNNVPLVDLAQAQPVISALSFAHFSPEAPQVHFASAFRSSLGHRPELWTAVEIHDFAPALER